MTIQPASAAPVQMTPKNDPAKVKDAAEQFEALLLSQMLRTAREAGTSGLGEGGSAGATAIEMAEGQMAQLMAKSGGLGLARMIVEQMRPVASTPASEGAAAETGTSPRR